MNLDDAMHLVRTEFKRAMKKFPRPFVNAHEGSSVIREEFEELWDEVKADNRHNQLLEAVQVAAMAVRFVVELSDRDEDKEEGRK